MKLYSRILFVLMLAGGYAFAKPVHNNINVADTAIKSVAVSGFTSIHVGGPFDVYLTQGNEETVKVEATKEFMDRIVVEVKDGVLKINRKHDNWGWGNDSWWGDKGIWHNHEHIKVYVTAKNLEAITVSGSSGVSFKDGITADGMRLRVSGSGHIEGKLMVKTLDSHISGSGSIDISGTAGSSSVGISGSGHFAARNLATASTAAHISGSGSAEVNASEQLDAKVSGSGGISYAGTPKIANHKTTGSGHISTL